MADRFVTIRTQGQDRWDIIAHRAYGDVNKLGLIIEANPSVPITPVIEAGTFIKVPVIAGTNVEQLRLPPWKRKR